MRIMNGSQQTTPSVDKKLCFETRKQQATDAHGIKVKVKNNMTLVFYKLVLLLNLQRGDIVNVLLLNWLYSVSFLVSQILNVQRFY